MNAVSAVTEFGNIGATLTRTAQRMPDALAVVAPDGRGYRQMSFAQLEKETNRIAWGLVQLGLQPGWRTVLMVRPSIEFLSLTFALFKAGAVIVLIDPGMGRRSLLRCLADVRPQALVAIPMAIAASRCFSGYFPDLRLRVSVGGRWAGGIPLDRVRGLGDSSPVLAPMAPDDPAAIIFTTGSTGPPKGVLYLHSNFAHQVQQIQARYNIQPGEVDLPGFPLFGLFNAAMGVATIIPDMDPTRPARVDPERILRAMRDWRVTQAFGSPAMWNTVGRYCHERGQRVATLTRVLSAGAPVPPHVLQRMMQAMAPGGQMHTPYGATEALPVASISAEEVLGETSQRSAQGAGTCVGTRFDGIEWQVIRAVDGPIADINDAQPLSPGEIGELIVRGPVVTSRYVTRVESNAQAKIRDGDGFWHRMGDVGYLDESDRFWFCGRMAHRVRTRRGDMYTVCCEAIFNQHPRIYRSALVGLGNAPDQTPAIVCQPWHDSWPAGRGEAERLRGELYELGQSSELTRSIAARHVLLHRSLPVDIRHNAKIQRERLAQWVATKR